MQGYYGRPEATAACFIPNPFAVGREEKLYCTGDWVTLDEKGDYLFVGRKDHMIKTRGYRVELGEIEARIGAHAAVAEVVVVALPDEEVTHRLKAVVVLKPGAAASAAELKQHCAQTLPRYMVPETLEFRTHLPRTSSGKVDRRQLRERAANLAKRGAG